MKCKLCGGELKVVDGIYICKSCNTKQSVSSFFEDIEVFIHYIENDLQGRRTKDSIIAQNIYNSLQKYKINTFYKRISLEVMSLEDAENACKEAMNKSGIIVIVGTSEEVFNSLLDELEDVLYLKRIIPVFSDISPNKLPEKLRYIQSLDYDNIGALNSLTKIITEFLKKETPQKEIIGGVTGTTVKSKKLILLIVSVVLVLVCVISYVVFGNPYVLKSKKYHYAKELVESGKYIDAINIYAELSDYENSWEELKKIYNKYDGYYTNADNSTDMHINIVNQTSISVKVRRFIDDKIIQFETVFLISPINSATEFSFDFKDSHEQFGKGTISFYDNGVRLVIKYNNTSASASNLDYTFSFEERTDAPLSPLITQRKVLNWLNNITTKEIFLDSGYELKAYDKYVYKITNTDIMLYFSELDYRAIDENWEKGNSNLIFQNSGFLCAVSGPASVIAPQLVGKSIEAYIDNDVYYRAFARVQSSSSEVFQPPKPMVLDNNLSVVDETTEIFVSTKEAVGELMWSEMCAN